MKNWAMSCAAIARYANALSQKLFEGGGCESLSAFVELGSHKCLDQAEKAENRDSGQHPEPGGQRSEFVKEHGME